MSGVEFGVVLSGVEFDCGLVVLLGDEFMFELLLLGFEGEVVEVVPLGVCGFVFASELLGPTVEESDVVDDGELEPVLPGLEGFEGVLCAAAEPLPAPLPSFPPAAGPLLWAKAIPAEKITAVARVKIRYRMPVLSCTLISVVPNLMAAGNRSLPKIRKQPDGR